MIFWLAGWLAGWLDFKMAVWFPAPCWTSDMQWVLGWVGI